MNANQNDSRVMRTVMRRVRIIRILRPLISTTTLAATLGFFALLGIGHEVFVAQVFQNVPTGVLSVGRFFLSAFSHTTFMVQALSLTILASGLWLLRDLVGNVILPKVSLVSA